MPETVFKKPEIPLREQDDGALLLLTREEPQGQAFRTFYERYQHEVYRFLCRMVQDPSQAEDLLQETFFKLHQNLARFHVGRPARPWLYQIARNTALNSLRKRVPPPVELERRADPSTQEGVAPQASLREQVAEIRQALSGLPGETRALLVQYHELGMSSAELAQSWQVSDRTIRNRLQKALDRLNRILRQTRGSQ